MPSFPQTYKSKPMLHKIHVFSNIASPWQNSSTIGKECFNEFSNTQINKYVQINNYTNTRKYDIDILFFGKGHILSYWFTDIWFGYSVQLAAYSILKGRCCHIDICQHCQQRKFPENTDISVSVDIKENNSINNSFKVHFPGILSTNQINIICAAALIPCVAGHQ